MDTVKTTPPAYKPTLAKLADESAKVICNHRYLHVWEVGSDLDDLLHLTYLMTKVQTRSAYIPRQNAKGKSIPDCTVLVVQDDPGRNNFKRVCELMAYLTRERGEPHCDGKVLVYSSVGVVKGVDPFRGTLSDGTYVADALKDAQAAVSRISQTIENVGVAGRKSQIVWHHGPVLHFFNFFISTTNQRIRDSFMAITINSTLHLGTKGLYPSENGRKNKLTDFQRLTHIIEKLDIHCTFLDPASQLLEVPFPNAYIYWWGYYYQIFLPSSLYLPHIALALDFLVMNCFRLFGASEKLSETEIVNVVKEHLDYDIAKPFAKDCVNFANYTMSLCKTAGSMANLDAMYCLTDAPFLPFSGGSVHAFSRLSIGPCAEANQPYLAVPIEIDFRTLKVRISSTSPYRLWVPTEGESAATIATRTRDNFMPVIEFIMQKNAGKSTVVRKNVANAVRAAWEEVRAACVWALDRCKNDIPWMMRARAMQTIDLFEKGVFNTQIHHPEKLRASLPGFVHG
jgi:hypothetical protein